MTGGTASPPISLTLCAHPRVTRVVSGRIHSPLIFPTGRPLICLRHGRLFRCQAAEEARCPWVTGRDVPSFSPTTRAQQEIFHRPQDSICKVQERVTYAKLLLILPTDLVCPSPKCPPEKGARSSFWLQKLDLFSHFN